MPASIVADRDRFLSFAFAASEVLIEIDQEGRMTFIAGGYTSMTGTKVEEDLERPLVDIVKPCDQVLVERTLAQLRKRQRIGPIQITMKNMSSPVILRGIQALEGNLQHLVFSRPMPGSGVSSTGEIDENSGLLVADDFNKVAHQHMIEARSGTNNTELTMIHLAGLAHLAGDTHKMADLLRHVGGVLRSLSVDGQSAGQLSDDRFGFIHRKGDAETVSEDIAEAIREHGIEEIGIDVQSVEIGEPLLSEHEAIKALGHVMRAFAGKVDGQESFATLDDALRQSYEETAHRISDFRRTVENLRFQIHFQPIVCLSDLTISHFEALSRFKGHDSPYEMINFAENVGITQDFDLAVVRKVLEQLEMRGSVKKKPKIAINLSTRSLDMDSFVEDLLRMLQGSGSLANTLTFEITESAEIKNLERMAKIIERIQRRGHHVALDDFGAGAAAFHYIRALKVNYVKIDGAYIKRILTDDRDASIVAAMVEMCRNLKVSTIAEMVETRAQLDALIDMKVDCAQGYLFARPAPSLDIASPIEMANEAVA